MNTYLIDWPYQFSEWLTTQLQLTSIRFFIFIVCCHWSNWNFLLGYNNNLSRNFYYRIPGIEFHNPVKNTISVSNECNWKRLLFVIFFFFIFGEETHTPIITCFTGNRKTIYTTVFAFTSSSSFFLEDLWFFESLQKKK